MCSAGPGAGVSSLIVLLLPACLLGSGALVERCAGESTSERAPLEQLPEPDLQPSGSDPVRSLPPPYQMVAHSDYNTRLRASQSSTAVGQKKEQTGLPFVTTQLPTLPARTRSTNDGARRTRYSPAPTATGQDDQTRSALTPGRYYDSYGDWHHAGGDEATHHWPSQHQPHGSAYVYHGNSAGGHWGWTPHHKHHPHHHGNVLAGIFDGVGLYPPHHHSGGLQLSVVLLHPVLLLGTVSFLVCLINAVVGLVDKIKLPLVRAQEVDRIASGSAQSTALRDGRDEPVLDQLYQFLNVALEHQQRQQQQRNESVVPGRS